MSATSTAPTTEGRTSVLLASSGGKPVIQIALDPVTGATTISSVGVDQAEIPAFLSRVATALTQARGWTSTAHRGC